VLVLESLLPLALEVIPRVVHDLVEHRGFRCTSLVVLEFLFCLLPRVAPEHTGLFGDLVLPVAARSRDKDSGGGSAVTAH
jgi:hypothetical protein